MYPKKQLAQLVISACQQFNIDTVVVSPGSRNAPLTIGLSNHKGINTLSVVDERCAAFFALGIAQQTQKPVAIVCTSGSALLNYYPAIAEAFYSKIPLVVISADRPKHLIDIGDGQTIRQENVFANHILFSANLIEDETLIKQNVNLVSEAMQIAMLKRGPVHINVPFNEPLYETVDALENFDFSITGEFKKIDIIANKVTQSVDDLAEVWNNSKRKLIIVGVNFPSDVLQRLIHEISEDASVLVMTEATSNLNSPKFINSIDKLISKLTPEEFEALQPEVLLTFGGMVVSKRIKQFLRKYKPKHHWHVDEQKPLDTYFSLSEFVQESPVTFLTTLNEKKIAIKSDYQQKWIQEKKARTIKHTTFLKTAPFSDLKVFETVLKTIPEDTLVQISNSSIIRYAQLFDLKDSLHFFCNRGTSGIDGSSATAIGAAFASQKEAVFITGDLSFFYDSNALWNANIPKNFRIIILNNAGGGIFKIIPGPKSTNALNYFETPHDLTAEHLAKMFKFEYQTAKSIAEVEKELSSFYIESHQPKILEIFTPSDLNDVILQQYFKSL